MQKKYFIFVVLLLCSCMNNRQIKVSSLEGVSVGGVKSGKLEMTVGLNVDNEYPKAKLEDAVITVFTEKSENPIFSIVLSEEVTVKKGKSVVSLPLELQLKGGVFGTIAIMSMVKKNPESLRFSVEAKVRKGLFNKNISLEKLTFNQILKFFGADAEILQQFLN